MRVYIKVMTKTEFFAPLLFHILQRNSWEHLGNINLGTSWEHFQRAFLIVKTVPKQHRNKTPLFIRPPNLLKYLYWFGQFHRERW
jgi:hypothetical protein